MSTWAKHTPITTSVAVLAPASMMRGASLGQPPSVRQTRKDQDPITGVFLSASIFFDPAAAPDRFGLYFRSGYDRPCVAARHNVEVRAKTAFAVLDSDSKPAHLPCRSPKNFSTSLRAGRWGDDWMMFVRVLGTRWSYIYTLARRTFAGTWLLVQRRWRSRRGRPWEIYCVC